MYALKVTCKKANSRAGVLVQAGTVVWVCQDEYGWSSSPHMHANLITFDDKRVAEDAAAKWEGHPWYYDPEKVEVVEVTPIYSQAITGYKVEQ